MDALKKILPCLILSIASLNAEEEKTVFDHIKEGVVYTAGAVVSMSAAGACAETGNLPLATAEVLLSAECAACALKEFQAAYREYYREPDGREADREHRGCEGMSFDRDSDLR